MNKNKTILMIAYYFSPASGVGTFRITKFSKYLKKLGFNPIIVSPNEKYYENKDNSLASDLAGIKRYNIELIGNNNSNEKKYYYSLLKSLKEIIKNENPNYAFITGGPFHYLKICQVLTKKYKIKCIVDFRDPWSLQKPINGNYLKIVKNKLYKKYAYCTERVIFKYAKYITTVNNTMTYDYKKLFPKYQDKIITLPNALDMEDYQKAKPYKFDNLTILYAGKFSTSSGFRNPTAFLKALKKINDERNNKINFVHIGYKEEKVKGIVDNLNCNKFVQFLGNKPYKETISYCKGADILLILSTNEKCEQTGKIYDYLGSNRKILALTQEGNEISKICKENNIKIIDPENEKNIEKAIIELINSKFDGYKTDNLDTREKITKQLIKLLN